MPDNNTQPQQIQPASTQAEITAPALQWIHEHDDRWSFIMVYVGGAIVLSIYAGLFWVGMLMLLHFILEYFRHKLISTPQAFMHALWEIKLDIGLFIFALVIVLYSDTVMAALGLGHAARATHAARAVRGAQVATRFGIIQRSLRVLLLIIDDLTKFCLAVWKGVSRRKNGHAKPVYESLEEARDHAIDGPPWLHMGKGDYFSIGFGLCCLLLLVLAPTLTGTETGTAISAILAELQP